MPYSMTGFASADALVSPFQINWELRSVNHRFLDLSFRLPEEFRRLEPAYRELATENFNRGKLDCTLKISVSAGDADRIELDHDALTTLTELQLVLKERFPDACALSVAELLRWPGVVKEPEQQLAQLAEPAMACLKQAIDELGQAREREGSRIAALLEQRNAGIMSLIAAIKPRLAAATKRYRAKLEQRLQRLDVQAQPERLEQELALIAQRMDIAEEVDRLESHVVEVRNVLTRDEPVGRKLDFIIQELNREANTLASKASDEELTRNAVELKVLIEQMREQVQNLE